MLTPPALAADLGALYPPAPDAVVNLEHGYFGAMALPVQHALEDAIRHTNTRLSPFLRGEFGHKHAEMLRVRLAKLINAEPHEILLKRQGMRPFKDMLTLADYEISNGVQLDLEVDTGD